MTNTTTHKDIWKLDESKADPDAIDAYDYALDEDRIAAEPADRRDQSRLLVYRRADDTIDHRHFEELGAAIDPGDLLVFNDTRVIPARVEVYKSTGGRVECFVLSVAEASPSQCWSDPANGDLRLQCMTRSSRPLRPGMELSDPDRPQMPTIEVESADAGRAVLRVDWQQSPLAFLERFGDVPLPPYIVRRRTSRGDPSVMERDVERYQTVYASTPGAVAAPTAGLHFTDKLLDKLDARGVHRCAVTLTVGPGTFQPVRTEELSDHDMHGEDYFIPEGLADAIAACRKRGGRIIAVGTTSARALEAEARRPAPFEPGWRRTDLFLRPGVPFEVCDGLITNFHLPRSTLLALVAAFVGYGSMRRIYREAVDTGYRFYSYGDASLLLRR